MVAGQGKLSSKQHIPPFLVDVKAELPSAKHSLRLRNVKACMRAARGGAATAAGRPFAGGRHPRRGR